ncbi:MAG: hypothetical protein AAGI44_07015 [Pseudomonadota bacterium]
MSFKRIILHAGLSKTGTTSVQANCDRYRELLAKYGANYPRFSFRGRAFENHSIPLTLSVSRRPGRYALGLRKQYGDDLDELIATCDAQLQAVLDAGGDTLILSSERIAGYAEEDLGILRDRVQPVAERFSVLLYLRSPFELLESILQERAKAGSVVDPLEIAGRSKRRYLLMQAAFGASLQVVNYHRAQQEAGGLVAGFFRYCGLPSTALEGIDFGLANRRMSWEAYLLMDAVNRAYPHREQSRHGVERSPGDLRVLGQLPGQRFAFPWEQASPTYQACLAEYEWFQHELGQEFPSPPQLGPSPLWQDNTRAALPTALGAISSLPIRNFLLDYLRDNDVEI